MSSGQEIQKHAAGITLRPATADDEQFLYNLYCSTRIEEMAAWGWPAEQQEMFLRLQFTAQKRHYEIAFEGSDHSVIERDGAAIGRLLVFRTEQEIRLVDIALLAGHRSGGIGSHLIRGLINEGARSGRPVTLHVGKANRAALLYERLGFSIVDDTGTDFRMEWRPAE
jgi:ribosomal protein S18 acetylase RimI-like enzyme